MEQQGCAPYPHGNHPLKFQYSGSLEELGGDALRTQVPHHVKQLSCELQEIRTLSSDFRTIYCMVVKNQVGSELSYLPASLREYVASPAGRYDNPILTRFLAPIDCSEIPALAIVTLFLAEGEESTGL